MTTRTAVTITVVVMGSIMLTILGTNWIMGMLQERATAPCSRFVNYPMKDVPARCVKELTL